jgi:hypothetical protein
MVDGMLSAKNSIRHSILLFGLAGCAEIGGGYLL